MRNKLSYILISCLLFQALYSKAQLVINEVSQGGQNPVVEYVELVVTGTNTCTSSTRDLRNWIIDDNNGTFKSGSGSGIAAGCVRFKNIPFWQNIKIGTLILIYDDESTSVNPLIPANDLNANDGNCRLVIPYSNTTLIEKHATQPGISNFNYPGTSTSFNSTNNWTSVLGMRNGGDAFQTRNPQNYTQVSHAVSWGDNVNNPVIYFAGDAQKQVYNMKNLVNDDPANQANWTSDSTLNGETPGVGNSPQNSAWIASLNNNCQAFTGINMTITATPAAASYCLGDTVRLTSSLPFGNQWSTGDTGNSITVVSSANITLKNAGACNLVIKVISFESTTAAFVTDTLIGYAPLNVDFTNNSQANAVHFTWNFGDNVIYVDSLSPEHTFTNPGIYQVVLTASNSNGCSDTAMRTITVLAPPDTLPKENLFSVPNVFTPNNDGVNDLFVIKHKNVTNFSGVIFDRWGNKVHTWSDIEEGWNGRTKSGKQVTNGVFFYILNVTFIDNSSITSTGTITVIN